MTLTRGTIVPLIVSLGAALPPPVATEESPPAVAGEPAAGSVKINPKDGAEMVYVPAGQFGMGDYDFTNSPTHIVKLSGNYIDFW